MADYRPPQSDSQENTNQTPSEIGNITGQPEAYPHFLQGVLIIVLYFVLTILLELLLEGLTALIGLENGITNNFIVQFIVFPVVVYYSLFRYIGLKSQRTIERAVARIKNVRLAVYLKGGLLIIGAGILSSELAYFVDTFLETDLGEMYFELTEQIMTAPFYIVILAVVVLPSFFEEILYRGIILEGFAHNYRPSTAVFLSALLFGLVHIFLIQVISAFIIGLFLGWLYLKSGSLLLVMFVHGLNNLLAVLQYYYLDTTGEITEMFFSPWYLLAGLLFLGVGWYSLSGSFFKDSRV